MDNAYKLGRACLKQAKWIGLKEYKIFLFCTQLLLCSNVIFRSNEKNHKTQLNKVMVEREDLVELGIKKGALKEQKGDWLLLDSN